MALVSGEPFLAHLLRYWRGQGLERFVLSVGYRRNVVMSYFGETFEGASLSYAVEEYPMGTGGGVILGARLATGDTFLLVNGDTFFGVELARLTAMHQGEGADVTVALVQVPENTRYGGVDLDASGRIRALDETGAARGEACVNGGVYLMRRRVLDGFTIRPRGSISLEREILPRLIGEGAKVFGQVQAGRFVDIGIPEDFVRAASVLTECPQ